MYSLTEITDVLKSENEPGALCIIISTSGSTPRKAGAKMLVFRNRRIHGSIGGGALEKNVIDNAIHVIETNMPQVFRHDLLHHHNMCCGGTVNVYIEPLVKKEKLYIFGAGHTGQFLAKLACDFGFETFVIDDRKEYTDGIKEENVNKMPTDFKLALSALPFDENTYVCIMTYNHAIDREILSFCANKPHRYLGMIGSRRKVELTRKMFLESKIAAQQVIDQIDMPMGLPMKAETPQEIALSILAKMIDTRNKR